MKTIDINTDLGEGFGRYRIADDIGLLDLVTSANIACGAHAGDPTIMYETVTAATERGVIVGAHIGFPDREGFGRRLIPMSHSELALLAITQLGALAAIASHAGTRLTHANFHGALGNLAISNRDAARVLLSAVKSFDPSLSFVGVTGSEAAEEAEEQGIHLVRSFLADRGYTGEGRLVPRAAPGALVKDPAAIRDRIVKLMRHGVLDTVDGETIEMEFDSILVHSDTAGSMEIAQTIRAAVLDAGAGIASFRS